MKLAQTDNVQKLILSEDIYNGVAKILRELTANTGAKMVVFCESNGYPVTHDGDTKGMDLQAISALAANNFSATAKMASMFGEGSGFKYVFLEGHDTNIYISDVGFNFILLVIFDASIALGMIRIFTKKAIGSLSELLASAKEDEQKSSQFLDLEFKTLLSEELDRSLKL